jgi:hypothetical protein
MYRLVRYAETHVRWFHCIRAESGILAPAHNVSMDSASNCRLSSCSLLLLVLREREAAREEDHKEKYRDEGNQIRKMHHVRCPSLWDDMAAVPLGGVSR